MKRCAIAIVAAAAMIAAPTAAISSVMLLHDNPVQPYASTVDPRVSIRNLGYECDNRGLRANSTYLSTSGQTVNNLCVLNPTGYYLQDTNNNNKLMASVQFNNVLHRDPATGKDVVVIGAVAFGSDDGKTTCCSAAGATIAPGPDPVINATCKPCQYVPRSRMAQSADVVFNVDFDTSVHVDFFDSAYPNAKRCDHESVAPRRSYQAWDSCTRPTELFAMTSPATTATCNVTITGPGDAAAL